MEILKRSLPTMLLIGLLASCVKEATIKLPKSENKLVLTCFISPQDSIITAVIRNSKPRIGAGSGSTSSSDLNSDQEDATVVLAGPEGQVNLVFDPQDRFYKGKGLKIREGATYSIEAFTPDGRKVTAQTTVPQGSLTINTFTVRIIQQDSTYINYEADIEIADLPGTTYVASFSKGVSLPAVNFDFMNYQASYFDNDEKVAKTKYASTFYGYMGAQFSGPGGPSSLFFAKVYAVALNCNKDFFLYHQSVEPAVYSGNSPFGDPALVYSNIQNGFGCFGAYVATFVESRIR